MSVSHGSDKVRVSSGLLGRVVAGKIVGMVIVILALSLAVYIAAAASVVRVVPTSTVGFVPVKNITYAGGKIPAGEIVLISRFHDQKNNPLGHLKQAFTMTDDAALVKVIHGPYGNAAFDGSQLLYEGVPVGLPTNGNDVVGEVKDQGFGVLADEYIAECVSGACDSGSALMFSKSNVIGKPLNDESRSK